MTELRIADADRERALAALGDHFAQGRLTRDEYDERADACWSARTASDLEPLFADLPDGSSLAAPPTRRTPDRAGRARAFVSGLPVPAKIALTVLAVLLVTSHLPLLLVAGLVWFALVRHGAAPRPAWSGRRDHRW